MRSSIRARRDIQRRTSLLVRALPRPRLLALAVGTAFAASTSPLLANPTGASVAAGGATFSVSGNTLTVTNTPGAIINWQQFSIQRDEITRFLQQNASSAVLNRVTGQDPTVILGQLFSNGRVFLINPSGIAFGQGAQINVAGLTASTLNISDADFISGRLRFAGTGAEGKLTNAGAITTSPGGSVYLIAPQVENQASGVITSPKGEVLIAAGRTVELVNAQTPDLRVEYTAPDNQAMNAGQIVASSGSVGIYGTLIRNSGLVSASRAEVGDGGRIVFKATQDVTLDPTSRLEATGDKGGEIKVQAEGGTLLADGAVEAKGENSSGGSIQLLGNQVGLVGAASVDASGDQGGGSVLVGGDFHGANPDVQNASRTYIGKDVAIKADAIAQGDGGKVVAWADGDTRFYGSINARGGSLQGDGGFVEVSGKESLLYRGYVDTRALNGAKGTLLLDPSSITITTGSAYTGSTGSLLTFPSNLTGTGDNIWAAGEDPGAGSIGADDVTAILGGTSLTLQASTGIVANPGV